MFKESKANTVVDALSRLLIETILTELDHSDEVICHITLENMSSVVKLSPLQGESNNEVLNELKCYIREGWRNYNSMSDNTASYNNMKDELDMFVIILS